MINCRCPYNFTKWVDVFRMISTLPDLKETLNLLGDRVFPEATSGKGCSLSHPHVPQDAILHIHCGFHTIFIKASIPLVIFQSQVASSKTLASISHSFTHTIMCILGDSGSEWMPTQHLATRGLSSSLSVYCSIPPQPCAVISVHLAFFILHF